jgi:ubiquitin carboxyl-terminal hydrolase L3
MAGAESSTEHEPYWLPLESNPEMLTAVARRLGMPQGWGFCDVFGVDAELLSLVPRPCTAVTLLFDSSSESVRAFKQVQSEAISAEGQHVSDNVFYIDQVVANACGTVATVHALCNSVDEIGIAPETPIGRFVADNKSATPAQRGAGLAAAADVHEASEAESQRGGQTATPALGEKISYHFVAFIEVFPPCSAAAVGVLPGWAHARVGGTPQPTHVRITHPAALHLTRPSNLTQRATFDQCCGSAGGRRRVRAGRAAGGPRQPRPRGR